MKKFSLPKKFKLVFSLEFIHKKYYILSKLGFVFIKCSTFKYEI